MTSPYGPILTGVGLLQNGQLTSVARASYVEEVVALLATGNANGKGGSPSTQIFSSLLPLPPTPGPNIANLTTLSVEPLFWFGPDPIAALIASTLRDPKTSPIWNAVFPDLLYGKTAVALDANGSTPLFPLFDASLLLPSLDVFPIPLPDLAVKLSLLPPSLLIKLADLGIQLQLPSIPLPPIPPQLPDIALPIPPLILLDLMIGLIKLPFDLLLKLLLPPDIGLVIKLLALDLSAIFDLAFGIVFQLLVDLNLLLIVPKVFVASLLIYLKNVVAMVAVDIVGMLVGAGGALTKLVAAGTGLIAPV
jgi:hypothetical protein